MADRVPNSPDPSWVWLIGLVIVVGGIALLIDWVVRGEATVEVEAQAAAELLSAADAERARERERDERRAAIEAVEHGSASIPLAGVLPLGPAHTGVQVTFEGTAAAVLDEGVWVRTDGALVFVRVVDANGAIIAERAGLTGRGIVRHDPLRVGGWAAAADLDRAVPAIADYYIETTVSRLRGR